MAVANGANALSEGFLFLVAALVIFAESYRGSRNRANVHNKLDADIHELREQLEKLTKDAPQSQPSGSIADRAQTPFDQADDGKYEALARSVALLWTLAEKNGWKPSSEELAKELRWALSAGDNSAEEESTDNSPSK